MAFPYGQSYLKGMKQGMIEQDKNSVVIPLNADKMSIITVGKQFDADKLVIG